MVFDLNGATQLPQLPCCLIHLWSNLHQISYHLMMFTGLTAPRPASPSPTYTHSQDQPLSTHLSLLVFSPKLTLSVLVHCPQCPALTHEAVCYVLTLVLSSPHPGLSHKYSPQSSGNSDERSWETNLKTHHLTSYLPPFCMPRAASQAKHG